MKAQELRLGNYVNCIVSENDHSRIVGITEEHPYIDEITFYYLVWEEIEPIELTTDWLIYLGAGKYFDCFIIGGFTLTWKELGYWYVSDGAGNYITKIDYVHELQNLAYILRDKELTLNKTK